MRIRSEQYISVLAIVALAFLASCTRNVKETQLTTENAKFNLIIAGDSSDFKDKIRNRIIAQYSNNGNIDVVNINKLENIRPEDYDVILIMDTCIGCEDFNWSMKSFLDRLEDNNNSSITYDNWLCALRIQLWRCRCNNCSFKNCK